MKIVERTTNQTWQFGVNSTSHSHVFNVSYGGVYEVSLATGRFNATHSKPVTYRAPPILPPFEVQVVTASNGSFVVYWQERQLPGSMGKYLYEVLVHEGNKMDESTAQR